MFSFSFCWFVYMRVWRKACNHLSFSTANNSATNRIQHGLSNREVGPSKYLLLSWCDLAVVNWFDVESKLDSWIGKAALGNKKIRRCYPAISFWDNHWSPSGGFMHTCILVCLSHPQIMHTQTHKIAIFYFLIISKLISISASNSHSCYSTYKWYNLETLYLS